MPLRRNPGGNSPAVRGERVEGCFPGRILRRRVQRMKRALPSHPCPGFSMLPHLPRRLFHASASPHMGVATHLRRSGWNIHKRHPLPFSPPKPRWILSNRDPWRELPGIEIAHPGNDFSNLQDGPCIKGQRTDHGRRGGELVLHRHVPVIRDELADFGSVLPRVEFAKEGREPGGGRKI